MYWPILDATELAANFTIAIWFYRWRGSLITFSSEMLKVYKLTYVYGVGNVWLMMGIWWAVHRSAIYKSVNYSVIRELVNRRHG